MPEARLFAEELIVAVTVAVPPLASVPPVGERVIQDARLPAVQFIDAFPVFVTVYVLVVGVKGPPTLPDGVNVVAGVTVMIGAGTATFRLTWLGCATPVVRFL